MNIKDSSLYDVFLSELRRKIPRGAELTTTLTDMLYLEREAVYRRLRGDVPFTFMEVVTIAKKLGISLDNLADSDALKSRPFQLKLVEYANPLEADFKMMQNFVEILAYARKEPDWEAGFSTNILPKCFYYYYPNITRFYLFKWLYQFEKIDIDNHFEDIEMVDKLLERQREFVRESQEFNRTEYIWDDQLFVYLINDIKYFASVHLISHEYVQKLKKELLQLLDELEEIATRGTFKTGKEVSIYIANVNFEATYSYIASSSYHVSLIRVFAINSFASHDEAVFKSVKEWIHSLKKFSTLISQSGEMQRIKFFKTQREIIEGLCV